jgi:hypothetical protein
VTRMASARSGVRVAGIVRGLSLGECLWPFGGRAIHDCRWQMAIERLVGAASSDRRRSPHCWYDIRTAIRTGSRPLEQVMVAGARIG